MVLDLLENFPFVHKTTLKKVIKERKKPKSIHNLWWIYGDKTSTPSGFLRPGLRN